MEKTGFTQLVDGLGRKHDYLRLSVTDRCNLRCVYCMPKEGLEFFPEKQVLSVAEILQLVKNFADLGIQKVRLTGGEPLIRKDILEIIQGISSLPTITDIAVTTNGLALPRLGEKLVTAGVKRLNISLDTFNEEQYRTMTRGGSLKQVLKGIEVAQSLPFQQIKINTVVIHGQNEKEILDFLIYTLDKKVNVRFIEFMPIGWSKKEQWQKNYTSLEEVFKVCKKAGFSYEPIQFSGNGPSENYQIKGAKGSFGLIHPVSCQFCENCNRLRVTADGYLKSCLYWEDEINLRPVLNDFSAFKKQVEKSLLQKPKNHEMALNQQKQATHKKPTWRYMSQIGG